MVGCFEILPLSRTSTRSFSSEMKRDKLGELLQAQQRLEVGLREESQFLLLCKLPLPDTSSPVLATDILQWKVLMKK